MASQSDFNIVLRGYDTEQVDALVQRVLDTLASDNPAQHASARDQLHRAAFDIRLRGYDRFQVKDYLQRLEEELTQS